MNSIRFGYLKERILMKMMWRVDSVFKRKGYGLSLTLHFSSETPVRMLSGSKSLQVTKVHVVNDK